MERRTFIKSLAAGAALTAIHPAFPAYSSEVKDGPVRPDFDKGWRFIREDIPGAEASAFDDAAWQSVTLPHTARVEDVVTGEPGTPSAQWQGICWYRKHFPVAAGDAGKMIFLRFEGAMNVAEVWLNGRQVGRHLGGFLPFVFDVTDQVVTGRDNIVAVRLDNRDNPVTGPKPMAQLDFNMYGGLYRSVHLIVKNRLHITDPIFADKPASGGLFVTHPRVSPEAATVRVQVHVRNDETSSQHFSIRTTLLDAKGKKILEHSSAPATLEAGTDTEITADLEVSRPKLWSLTDPYLYTVRVEIVRDGKVTDTEQVRTGIRRIAISKDGFLLNGKKVFLRGTNQHQEYPYIGYAVGDDAQYRDAKKIKEAGFDYIRLSHYPHAPAFMDACDELGLVVMDSIPGWQYFNRQDPAFTELQYENSRRMIRRDRNHPCVIMWEVSLNETGMPPEFIRQTHAIGHEEYPGDQTYTCGWQKGYDVFIQARQHGGCHKETDYPCVVSEYGDWEYYAQNAGLNQEAWKDLAPDDANSRQLRWHGERRLLQQATNFQEAHNDNRTTIAFGDGLWVMYDYNRGYAPDIESSGVMDLFRLPKFSYYFFQSQRDATERLPGVQSGPMVFVASYWKPDSPTDVRVFSNCEEVSLLLNGKIVERRKPDQDRISTHLAHPPFTFHLGRFTPGVLEAVGYIGGRAVARHSVRTPGAIDRMTLRLDLGGRPFGHQAKDSVFVYGELRDAEGTLVPDAWENVSFGTTGSVSLVGRNPASSEAGIAGAVLQADQDRASGAVYALSIVRDGGRVRILSASVPAGGRAASYQVRYTTDGTQPGPRSSRYARPFTGDGRVRAALLVGGKIVAEADTDTPKYRIPGSTAPKGN